eukprot:g5600.t1
MKKKLYKTKEKETKDDKTKEKETKENETKENDKSKKEEKYKKWEVLITEQHKIECTDSCNSCELPADAKCNEPENGKCSKPLKKVFVPDGGGSMKLHCCEKLEVKAPLQELDDAKDCQEKGVITSALGRKEREEVTDGSKTYLCKPGTFFKLRLRMKDREIAQSIGESSSDSASPSATNTATKPHGRMCCNLYKNLGKDFVSVEDVDKTLDKLNEGESETVLADQVEEESARLDKLSPGICCMEFMEMRTKNILDNGSDEAPGMLKQFLDVVVIPIAMKEMTQEEFEQGVSKMSELWGSDVWDLLTTNVGNIVDGLNAMLDNHDDFWSHTDKNVVPELARLQQEKEGIDKMIERFRAKYVKRDDTNKDNVAKRKQIYEEFKSRKDRLNMDKAPTTKEELKGYIETHRVHMKPMADLYNEVKLFHGGVINSATIGKPADPENQEGGIIKSVDGKGLPDVIELRVPVKDYAKHMEASIRPEHFKKDAKMRVLYSPKDYIPQIKAAFVASSNKNSMVPHGCSKASILGCRMGSTAVFKNTEKYCCSSPTISADVAKDPSKCQPGKKFSGSIFFKSKEKLKSSEDGKIYTCEKGTFWDYYMSSLASSPSTSPEEEEETRNQLMDEAQKLGEEEQLREGGGG